MERHVSMLVIFMACLLLALGDKFPSKGGTTRNLGVRHRLPVADDHQDNTNRKRLHALRGNEEDKSNSSSAIQHIRDLLGLASKSEILQWLVKVIKLERLQSRVYAKVIAFFLLSRKSLGACWHYVMQPNTDILAFIYISSQNTHSLRKIFNSTFNH